MAIEIIPAVMPKNYDDLAEKSRLFSGIAPIIQLDIMDGHFVPARTWPYPRDAHFDAIVAEEEGMPSWDTLDFEIDLMVGNPEKVVPFWVRVGARRIIAHIESVKDFECIRGAVPHGVELGLAIGTETPIALIEPYLDRIDFVQCMGIARIGFQGEPFDPRALDCVKEVREIYPGIPVSVDGAVNFETARKFVDAGATRLVSGSAILESGDISSALAKMKNLLS